MNPVALDSVKVQLARQVAHWSMAAAELSNLSRLGSQAGWRSLERHLGLALEATLKESTLRLVRQANRLEAVLAAAESDAELERLGTDLLAFRGQYLAVETMADFYADCVETRTHEHIGSYLRACDALGVRALAAFLEPLGRKAPPILTYRDRGLGASILKAGLPLWDGRTVSPVAAIKIVRHNLFRPTSLFHEVGHQGAAQVGWNDELARALRAGLARHGDTLADLWASWASELAADAFCFAHAGYGAVVTLYDVLADPEWVHRHVPRDPHPVGYLRILLGRAMCVRFFGAGPWDALARAWIRTYPPSTATGGMADVVRRSTDLLEAIVDLLFLAPLRCFGGKCLSDLVDPTRVKPEALAELEREAGPALFVSEHWIDRECLRLVALSGLRGAVAGNAREVARQQEQWMLRLGQMTADA